MDALACSFGTTHGIYLTEPRLDFSVVRNVRGMTEYLPVVMHGGSGVSKEDFHKAVRSGVRKINYFTYMDKSGGTADEEYLKGLQKNEPRFFSAIMVAAREAMKEKRLNEAFAGVYEPFLAQQDVRVNEELLGKQTAADASATSTSSFFEVYDEYF